jgi:hypothetical protein
MHRHSVMHRSHKANVMHRARQLWQVFANLNVGSGRGNGTEFATDLTGSLRLHVPHVQLTGATEEKDKDTGPTAGHPSTRRGLQRQQVRE